MRDPNRIPEILKKIEALWQKHPDQRLGQLVLNATRHLNWNITCPSLFYLEDEDFREALDRWNAMQ